MLRHGGARGARPYRSDVVARAPLSSVHKEDAAIAAALMGERANAVAEAMARETGKALKDVRAKLLRSEDTKQLLAKEVCVSRVSTCRSTSPRWRRGRSP